MFNTNQNYELIKDLYGPELYVTWNLTNKRSVHNSDSVLCLWHWRRFCSVPEDQKRFLCDLEETEN